MTQASQLIASNQLNSEINRRTWSGIGINDVAFGAVGDYNPTTGEGTDDTAAIQSALDYLYANGGGTLFLSRPAYKITSPLIMKLSNASGYDLPIVTIKGKANRGNAIYKVGTNALYGLDAAIILIRGDTLNINDSFSGAGFDSVKFYNKSTAATTYGLYGKSGARIIAAYSSFETIRDLATVGTHDRYAVYLGTCWACSFRDCTVSGDYGIYTNASCTSLLLENIFAGADKIAYRINAVYSTMINCYGDFCNGTMFYFYFSSIHCTAIAGESPNCGTMIEVFNSRITVDKAHFIQSNQDSGMVIKMAGSDLKIQELTVNMQSGATLGYLWEGGTTASLLINRLTLSGSGNKFKYSYATNMSANALSATVYPDDHINLKGIVPVLPIANKYWDWYVETPTLPINNIVFGMNTPTTYSNGDDARFVGGGILDAFYLNTDFSAYPVLGWGRYDQTSNVLLNGSNWYVPFILSGTTANRPTWRTTGMSYFDTTLNKPVWWNGTNWVDATGTTV